MFFTDFQKAKEQIESERAGKTVVFTNGCFDLLHVGHVRYLQDAKALGDILVVGVNSDASVRRLNKGPERPLQHEQDRSDILLGLSSVDHAVIFDDDTPLSLIETIGPDVLVKGGDWAIDQIVGSAFVLGRGGKVQSLQFVEGRSSTGIVEKIKNSLS